MLSTKQSPGFALCQAKLLSTKQRKNSIFYEKKKKKKMAKDTQFFDLSNFPIIFDIMFFGERITFLTSPCSALTSYYIMVSS